jgi:hypothetical protein
MLWIFLQHCILIIQYNLTFMIPQFMSSHRLQHFFQFPSIFLYDNAFFTLILLFRSFKFTAIFIFRALTEGTVLT